MRPGVTTIVAMVLIVGLSAFSAAEHDAGDERDASFLGSSTTDHDLNQFCADTLEEDECPTRIIRGLMFITCDHTDDSVDPAGLYDGLGGVSFCEIPMGTTITLQYTDTASIVEALGTVTCPETTGSVWNPELGTLQGDEPVEIEIPHWCDEESSTGHEGHTRVNIFNIVAATHVGEGASQVGFPVEGEITLSM